MCLVIFYFEKKKFLILKRKCMQNYFETPKCHEIIVLVLPWYSNFILHLKILSLFSYVSTYNKREGP